jgi:hypothetical protein
MPSVSFEIAADKLSKSTFHNADSKRCYMCVSSFNSKTLARNRASGPQIIRYRKITLTANSDWTIRTMKVTMIYK